MDQNESTSGVNTILLVVVLMFVVGALVWYFAAGQRTQDAAPEPQGINVDVNLPEGNNQGEQPPAQN